MNTRVVVLLATCAAALHPMQYKAGHTKHLAALSEHQVPAGGQAQLPKECRQDMQRMGNASFAEEAAACEKDGKYPEKAISALQKRDEKGATAHIEDLFVKCAKLTKDCAARVSPDLVIQLRFSGAAVTDECAKKMEGVHQDEKTAKAVQQCDKKENMTANVLSALNQGDLNGAISAAESGLEKCMSMSETCSYQLAPVIINSFVMRAMLEQGQMEEAPTTTVLVAQPVLVVEEPVVVVDEQPVMVVEEIPSDPASSKTAVKPAAASVPKTPGSTKKHGPVSLLAIASQIAPLSPQHQLHQAAAPALLQENAHHHTLVSKLIFKLAHQQHKA